MFVATQDGIFTAVRHQHNVLKITAESPDILLRLHVFTGGSMHDQFDREFIFVTDQEWVEFLTAHTQDIQYDQFPPVS
jgi:sulfur transfer complex TusBCD TusB component (DsrH family)